MEELKKSWKVVVFASIVALLSSTIVGFIAARNTKVDNAAPREYVDKQDNRLQIQIDKKADEKTVNQMKETLKTIDGRIYDLWKVNHEKKK